MALAANLQRYSNETAPSTSMHSQNKAEIDLPHTPDGKASLAHTTNQYAREQSNFQIPLVDFSKYLHGTAEEKTQCVSEIMKGFTTSGFLYLTNSGLSPKPAYEWSEKYFALPTAEKTKHPNNNSAENRGYSGLGIEKVTNLDLGAGGNKESVRKLRASLPDIKESLEIGSDPGPRYPAKPQ
ncbi:hypothetical protein Vi05172_g2153 [Venturia inaequalis]|uniref:Non-haem dioxygenase N-terminal domain-containing protein n=1 Tax=Venturia inaequalis TaxID=5025 RepID=A0A8H3UD25_VENIN|nr:hypothetical protein EG327_011107 [Venturia inaequalis]RDI88131.1 hypothetical protein Vi05172_g2153 [Venturia inaequalis]